MLRRPPRSTLTATHFPYTTLFRSIVRMLRASPDAARERIERGRADTINCPAPDACTVKGSDVAWRTRIESDGDTSYTVEGFAAYGDARDLARESIRQHRIVPGVIEVATTSVGGDDSFARRLAGTVDLDKALAEGYRRNHSGDYADAAEFFEALSRRAEEESGVTGLDPTEFTLNRALQKSNLGQFAEAERLFTEAEAVPTSDPVQLRLRRNFRAIHALNQQDYDAAATILQTPIAPLANPIETDGASVTLTPQIAAGLNSGGAGVVQQAADSERLTPAERATISDAQATHLLGVVERLRGDASSEERRVGKTGGKHGG